MNTLTPSQKHSVAFCKEAKVTIADLSDGLTEAGSLRFMGSLRHEYHHIDNDNPVNMLVALQKFVHASIGQENREGHRKWVLPWLREKFEAVNARLSKGGYSWENAMFEFS